MRPRATLPTTPRRRLSSLAIIALSIASAGCASSDSGGGGGTTDAGNGAQDAGASQCNLGLVVPTVANLGQELEVIAEVFPADLPGERQFTWRITYGGVEQVLTQLANPNDRVSFTAAQAGTYQVLVDATIGGLTCPQGQDVINVVAAGAISRDYRMRVVPLSGAPFQDFTVAIFGGADTNLPSKSLEIGNVVNGILTDSNGTGIPAYLRARKRSTAVVTDYEGFSDANGAFSLRLPTGRYDFLAVPTGGALPSFLLEDQNYTDLSTTIAMPAPETLTGHVIDVGNGAVQGARVSLVIDGVATSTATTAADGSFSVLGTGGVLTALRVAPAPNSGFPALRAEGLSGQSITDQSDVVIQYTSATVSAEVDLSLAGGGAAAFALVEWRAQSTQAATVSAGGSEDVAGDLRVIATTDVSGIAQANVSAGVADLAVQSSDASEALVQPALDWAATPNRAFAMAALVPVSVAVTFASAAAQGAQILAVPVDSLAPQGVAASASVPSSGTASLNLVRGGNYELIAYRSDLGTRVSVISDVAPAMVVTDIDLPATLLATGSITVEGGTATGARVSLYCAACSGPEATRVLARAVVKSTGKYELRVEDPGVAP